jgi:PLD-like domain
MRIELQLQGVFKRISSDTVPEPVELSELVDDIQAIASQQHYHSLSYIRSHFGLNILPEKALGKYLPNSPYLIPSLKILYPTFTSPIDLPINYYKYSFISNEFTLDLNADDSQLPNWSKAEVYGKYTLIITSSSDPQTQSKWQEVQQLAKKLAPVNIIHHALRSSNLVRFRIQFSSTLAIVLEIDELPIHTKEVIIALRDKEDTSQLTSDAQKLITQYQRKFPKNIQIDPQSISISSTSSPSQSLLISKGNNRESLERIIKEAEEFLLLSSYRIEDENIANLIAEKVSSLNQGVWILSDYGHDVIDRIDPRVDTGDEYEKSDFKKKQCLRVLARSGAYIRSGNFHLKVCISEKQAYLGSCNLTGGSLDFNTEAGIIWSNNSQHQHLVQLFSQYWRSHSTDMITPSLNGITRSTVQATSRTAKNYLNFLSPQEYQRDIMRELRNLPTKSNVKIYTRNFEPSPSMQELIQFQNYQIYYGNYASSRLLTRQLPNLHAKITILGKQCAYIGGINFAFTPQFSPLYDLMYKITNAAAIAQIESCIYNIHS